MLARRSRPTPAASTPRWSRSGSRDGVTDPAELENYVDQDVAAIFVQNPNFLGSIEDLEALAAAAHESGALCVASVDAPVLGVLKPPGEAGVDIAVGEGQPLGNRLDFGGPSFGFFAATTEHLRRMPGRIAGEATDADGRRGFVLALQTREQHIRREKATHNICTSQALNALAGTIYLAWLGRRGIVELGELLVRRTAYARQALAAVDGVELLHHGAGRARVCGRARCARSPRSSTGSPPRGSPPAIRSAASTPSTRTACWSRSPSAARKEDIDRLADALGRAIAGAANQRRAARGLGMSERPPATAEIPTAAAARGGGDHLRALGRGPARRRPAAARRPRDAARRADPGEVPAFRGAARCPRSPSPRSSATTTASRGATSTSTPAPTRSARAR